MATIAELLASFLDALKQVQQGNDFTIIRSRLTLFCHVDMYSVVFFNMSSLLMALLAVCLFSFETLYR